MKSIIGQKILVVDEDSDVIKSITDLFARQERETTVLSARSADVAVEMAWQKKPDMMIVNTELVDLSGWELLGILKKNDPTRGIPFVMMDKAGRMEDEIRALNAGADDYISKPFKPDLFLARVKAVLRRYLNWSGQKPDAEEKLKSGNIEINMVTHTIYVKGEEIDLTPKEFALLYLFMKKQNRVLNRVFLSGTIWEREYFDTSHTIDRHIANLRKKLGSEGKRIETLHSIGYKFSGVKDSKESYN